LCQCRGYRCIFVPCTQTFSKHDSLRPHHCKHLNIRPYECPHILDVLSNPSDPCSPIYFVCDSRYEDTAVLTNHRKKQHKYEASRSAGGLSKRPEVRDMRDVPRVHIHAPDYSPLRLARKRDAVRRDMALQRQISEFTATTKEQKNQDASSCAASTMHPSHEYPQHPSPALNKRSPLLLSTPPHCPVSNELTSNSASMYYASPNPPPVSRYHPALSPNVPSHLYLPSPGFAELRLPPLQHMPSPHVHPRCADEYQYDLRR
jgi:hypothetical protein